MTRTEKLILAVVLIQVVGVGVLFYQLERANRSLDNAEKAVVDTTRDVQAVAQGIKAFLPR
jgi:hypothetical protein